MKPLLLSLSLLIPNFAHAGSFVIGAGGWTCEELLQANETQDVGKIFQSVGWILGYWSAETKYRDDNFASIVEQAGGRAIFNQTLNECRQAPEGTQIYQLVNSMMENTG